MSAMTRRSRQGLLRWLPTAEILCFHQKRNVLRSTCNTQSEFPQTCSDIRFEDQHRIRKKASRSKLCSFICCQFEKLWKSDFISLATGRDHKNCVSAKTDKRLLLPIWKIVKIWVCDQFLSCGAFSIKLLCAQTTETDSFFCCCIKKLRKTDLLLNCHE